MSGYQTPPLRQCSPSQAYDSPPATKLGRNPSDEEFEHLRRAPQKGERPAELRAMHESAAQACAKYDLFNSSSPQPFSLTSTSTQASNTPSISSIASLVPKITSLR